MKRKLLICIPSLRFGGAAKIALNISEYFLDNNLDVTILLTRDSGKDLGFEALPAGLRVVAVPKRKGNALFQFLFSVRWLVRFFKENRPTSILAVRHDATMLSGLAWRLAGRPGAFYIREINPIDKTLNRKKAFVLLLRSAYASAQGIIANSQDVAVALKNKGWLDAARIHTIDNPVITKSFFDKASAQVEDGILPKDNVPVIISIGRLNKMKDFASLIRAFKIVKEQMDCRLLIIGDGSERESLQNLIDTLGLEEMVTLTGAMENPYPYLKASSLFVLTSKYEGFGNVLVEALALGKKIVSTRCVGGPAYILNYGEHGALVNVGAIEEIAGAILQSFESPADFEKLHHRGLDFSVSKIGRAYSEVLFKN
jgi:glycosyltransferase involved in cell wall biosynthesis